MTSQNIIDVSGRLPDMVIDVYDAYLWSDSPLDIVKFYHELPTTGIGVKEYSVKQLAEGIKKLPDIEEAVKATCGVPRPTYKGDFPSSRGDLMDIKEFVESNFLDCDGHGEWSDGTLVYKRYNTDWVKPSSFKRFGVPDPRFTHILWFNK